MKQYLISFLALIGTVSSFPYSHDNCDVDSYYAGLPGSSVDWTRDQLFTLLKETHRSVLPFTTPNFAGTDDTWGALIDLDKGSGNNTVHLVYNDSEKPAFPFGVRTWGKEHLWPTTRGIGTTGPDYTDIHNLRPAATLPARVRAEKYFGMCGILVRPETCEEPAQGAAPDTCSCNRLYQPPADKRGDIARALMYMDVRYDGSDKDTVDLTLTDCPFNMETDMAYKSQMLTWHAEDPPDENEITRNQLACVRWQGNRNPFIDHATLATQIFGTPLSLPLVGERLIYPECELVPTSAPTPTANVCDSMNPGDIFFFLINSMQPGNVGLFNFQPLPAGFEVFLTDNAWTGSEWLTNEGIIKVRTVFVNTLLLSYSYRCHDG
jgi:endonuclease I